MKFYKLQIILFENCKIIKSLYVIIHQVTSIIVIISIISIYW